MRENAIAHPGRRYVPQHWRESRTVLILKKTSPTCGDLRPIALTDVSYKVFFGMIKEKIFEHMKYQNCIMELQAGFTQGCRLEDNLLLVRYCVGESVRMKKMLVLCAIDFAKAFNSVDRRCIIQAMISMMKYKCHPRLIDVVSRIYDEDRTSLFFGRDKVGDLNLKSGIRQGCTGSPWLFVMIVNRLIEELGNINRSWIQE